MAPWFCACWMIAVLLGHISAEPESPPDYVIHNTPASFEQAMQECSPGVLTSLSTEHQLTDVLGLVSTSLSPQNQTEFNFWVGLKKAKNECVVPTLALKGFRWVEDGSEAAEVSRWVEEPKPTCITVRCAALNGELTGSTVTRWGLSSVTCKSRYQFICLNLGPLHLNLDPLYLNLDLLYLNLDPLRLNLGPLHLNLDPLHLNLDPLHLNLDPLHLNLGPLHLNLTPLYLNLGRLHLNLGPLHLNLTPLYLNLGRLHLNLGPLHLNLGPLHLNLTPLYLNLTPLEPATNTETTLETGPDADHGPGPAERSDSCKRPSITDARSLSLDPSNSSSIQVECWSSAQVELRCWGRPAVWRLLDDSPANLTAVCQPCDVGFQKSIDGNCEDINECSGGGAFCRQTCLNTVGSFRCVCSDDNGTHHDEYSPACMDAPATGDITWMTDVMTLVLIAVAALVVLVVVLVVVVRCCFIRRSKKRAMKKAEKMAMTSKDDKDSFEKAAI
ncbi:C-type lectin domain family 14 member A [Brachionichthys hirsutus]|uniref:C-type lectin domain family 14 member A n=1 Tax=Brachionichthys hirsutus TaxID=412623 RepID=UPI003605132C